MWSWEVPWSAIFKLQNQESWGHNSVRVSRSYNLVRRWGNSQPWGQGLYKWRRWRRPIGIRTRRTWQSGVQGQEKTDILAQEKQREFTLPPSFCSLQVLSGLNNAYPQSCAQSVLLSLPKQMLISPRDTSQTHPSIVFTSYLGIHLLSQVDTYNCHRASQILLVLFWYSHKSFLIVGVWETFGLWFWVLSLYYCQGPLSFVFQCLSSGWEGLVRWAT